MAFTPLVITHQELVETVQKRDQTRLVFVYTLSYQIKQGRRWVNESQVFLSPEGRNDEAERVERLYMGDLRNLEKGSKLLHA